MEEDFFGNKVKEKMNKKNLPLAFSYKKKWNILTFIQQKENTLGWIECFLSLSVTFIPSFFFIFIFIFE